MPARKHRTSAVSRRLAVPLVRAVRGGLHPRTLGGSESGVQLHSSRVERTWLLTVAQRRLDGRIEWKS